MKNDKSIQKAEESSPDGLLDSLLTGAVEAGALFHAVLHRFPREEGETEKDHWARVFPLYGQLMIKKSYKEMAAYLNQEADKL